MKYRPEIDGLRAVAVLPVILFHAGFWTFRGGFVGVDVFFVISGYLITTILLNELADGQFSIGQFYARRARRILPALFVVVAACIPFAWLWMTPVEFESFGRSVIAVLLFVSNIQFWQEGGYFSAAADLMPLLHTWSLAVEEQFYVIFPLLLMSVWRFGRRVIFGLLFSLAVLSLLWAEMQWRFSPPVSFFLSHTRAWELLVGSLCALILSRRSLPANNWLAGVGLAMIIVAVLRFGWWTQMPGIRGLVPVLGTALIILYGSTGTLVARLLSTRVFVGIGLISYSTYLWHQPLFAFARLRGLENLTTEALLALSAASLLLGWLTWRLVEIPWRRKDGITFRRPKASIAAGATFAIALFGVGASAMVTNGVPQRFPDVPRQQFTEGVWSRNCLFQARDGRVSFPTEECIFGTGSVKIAILGDSIAASLAPALIDRLGDENLEIHQLTHGMCMPAVRTIATTPLAVACADYMERAVRHLEDLNVDLVITAASWPDFGESTLYDGESISDMTGAQRDLVVRDIAITLERLGAPVLMVMPHPHADVRILDTAARHYMSRGEPIVEMSVSLERFFADNAVAFDILSSVEGPDIMKVFAHEAMCDNERCYFVQDGKLILSDNQHLTRYGAERVLALPAFNEALSRSLRRRQAALVTEAVHFD